MMGPYLGYNAAKAGNHMMRADNWNTFMACCNHCIQMRHLFREQSALKWKGEVTRRAEANPL